MNCTQEHSPVFPAIPRRWLHGWLVSWIVHPVRPRRNRPLTSADIKEAHKHRITDLRIDVAYALRVRIAHTRWVYMRVCVCE